jgi:uncharacterized 2Fe-2S/4Fe-4S cluster protein (DUF4445 family)
MSLTVHPPVGAPVTLPTTGADAHLAAFLERHGHPLNTRCGCRGLCSGCTVRLQDDATRAERSVQACRTDIATLAPGTQVRIPAVSSRDGSLHGVTAFEVRASSARPLPRPGLGFAVDIGTTTVAAALWDLASGACLAEGARGNQQRAHGDNVVTRIGFSLENAGGLDRLRASLCDGTLAPLLLDLCAQAGVGIEAVTELVAVGNPTMLHTFAGASLKGLATFPFHPVFLGERILPPHEHRLPVACDARLAAALGPFVGADITAGALASGMLDAPGPLLLIDFGTNGEILLKQGDTYLATATAAGPAFEGGRLACGAAAKPGVISSLRLEDGRWQWTLTGGGAGRPSGISGAAYVDFIACASRAGILGALGRMDPRHPLVERAADAPPGAALRCRIDRDIFISEADVAELLQAKAAIAAGVATLLGLAGLAPTDLRTLFVAGGFGYHLDHANARVLGLLPALPLERVSTIGNSALGGACLLLLSRDHGPIERLRAATRVVELNQIPTFEDHYVDALGITGDADCKDS